MAMRKDCYKYSNYNFENEQCQMCEDSADCSKIPSCYKNFNTKSEWCTGHCRYSLDCSDGKQDVDAIKRLQVMRKQGKITFKEFVDLSMPIVRENAQKNPKVNQPNFQPYTPPVYMPKTKKRKQTKVPEHIQERMDWVNH